MSILPRSKKIGGYPYQNNTSVINTDISNKIQINPSIQYKKLNEYKELNNQGANLINNKNYNEALDVYEKSLQLAESLNDNFKRNDAKCNLGIVKFHLGKLNDAINFIQPCYEYFNYICIEKNEGTNLQNLIMLCKSGVNLCMCLITMNSENKDPIPIIENIISIISNEELYDIYVQKFCLEYINKSLFKTKSLLNNICDEEDENLPINSHIGGNIEDKNNNIKINQALNNFLGTQQLEQWINALIEIKQKMIQINDNNGVIYALFNELMANYLKSETINQNNNNLNQEEIIDARKKLTAFFRTLSQTTGNGNDNALTNYMDNNGENPMNQNENNEEDNLIITDEYINDVIEDYKNKLFTIIKIYRILNEFEGQIDEQLQENYYPNNLMQDYIQCQAQYNEKNQKINFIYDVKAKYFIKLLLNYNLNYFKSTIPEKKLKINLINETKKTIDMIECDKVDISKMYLSSIDLELTESLMTLFNDVFNIYHVSKMRPYFDKFKSFKFFKKKSLVKSINKSVPDIYKKIKNFFGKKYSYIYKGEEIDKINYGSKGYKKHFYQIDYENDLFESFPLDKNAKSPDKTYDFDNILKILVGYKTKNVKSRLGQLNLPNKNKPYLFLSLLLRGRSIDLFFEKETSAKSWFYGFSHYLRMSGSDRPFKIGSCTRYILFRLKCKMLLKIDKNCDDIDNKSFISCINEYFGQ